jgi:hypothetical protein
MPSADWESNMLSIQGLNAEVDEKEILKDSI